MPLPQGLAVLALFLAATCAAAAPKTYSASLSGAAEVPPNASPATGHVTVVFDIAAHSLYLDADFAGLLGHSTAAHIHCCTAAPLSGTAGVATMLPTFTGFPAGVHAGDYYATFDTSLAATWNPAFIASHGGTTAGAEAALLAGLDGRRAYFNIHSDSFTSGEIRGNLAPVPEPAMGLMLGLGLPLLWGARRRWC
ncbi:CHRD domain-containing protein [Massilia sp. BJB1822]|nr:CHRD domain-containing protein [Massilia sp. BJB1822]